MQPGRNGLEYCCHLLFVKQDFYGLICKHSLRIFCSGFTLLNCFATLLYGVKFHFENCFFSVRVWQFKYTLYAYIYFSYLKCHQIRIIASVKSYLNVSCQFRFLGLLDMLKSGSIFHPRNRGIFPRMTRILASAAKKIICSVNLISAY